MEKVLCLVPINLNSSLYQTGSFTLPKPQIWPTLARHLTNPSPHHKGVLLGTDQHKSTAITGNTTHRTYPTNRGPSGTPRTALCPEEMSLFARMPHLLFELLELKKGLLTLGPEPLFKKMKREAVTTFI